MITLFILNITIMLLVWMTYAAVILAANVIDFVLNFVYGFITGFVSAYRAEASKQIEAAKLPALEEKTISNS